MNDQLTVPKHVFDVIDWPSSIKNSVNNKHMESFYWVLDNVDGAIQSSINMGFTSRIPVDVIRSYVSKNKKISHTKIVTDLIVNGNPDLAEELIFSEARINPVSVFHNLLYRNVPKRELFSYLMKSMKKKQLKEMNKILEREYWRFLDFYFEESFAARVVASLVTCDQVCFDKFLDVVRGILSGKTKCSHNKNVNNDISCFLNLFDLEIGDLQNQTNFVLSEERYNEIYKNMSNYADMLEVHSS